MMNCTLAWHGCGTKTKHEMLCHHIIFFFTTTTATACHVDMLCNLLLDCRSHQWMDKASTERVPQVKKLMSLLKWKKIVKIKRGNTVETYDPELSKRRKSEDHYLASRKQNGEANGSSKMYAERDYKEKSKQQSHSSKSKEQFNETDGSPKLKMKEKRDKSYP
ncbi:uncharacterized protein LOC129925689 [Biomphalaria glabrata]|uniref:Uncharacterized protein LOC129921903 isoform X1 n=1 Tax=Biomphalaria glabrata TaxID=6526 RepID=A0A9W2YEE2_BIOGL|nr:uncharacterized protein LOC129921903 isoform X1 [Biomphalaria glabrata]XP_055881729.1 uncharacterized protein LOC129925689 [Biomphalaria glabrata]KAI8730191.1 THO complex subunit 2 [Biomphalaria glabrata]